MKLTTPRRVFLIQPVVPSYRTAFFSSISKRLGPRFSVHASDLDMGVLTEKPQRDSWWNPLGATRRLFPGAEWQIGALWIPISRGDVVVISGNPRCLSNLALLIRARLLGAKTIWWGQLWSGTSRAHRFLLRLMLMRLAHAVLFYTDVEVTTYKAEYGRNDRRPLCALNNGLFLKSIQAMREPYDPSVRGATILFIGRLTKKAQIDLLLQAMTQPALATAALHIIGDGPDASDLKEWSHTHGLETRIFWHGGVVDESVIAGIANQASVFCYPGGVGLSLVHAMAYGLPAVVHNDRRTHMPEIAAFDDGITGRSFLKGNAEALAKTLAALLNEKNALVKMSQIARLRADTMYNTDSMAERFVGFLDEIESR